MPRRPPAYSPEQRRNVGIANRLSARDSERVRRSLIEAMLVESGARNLDYGDRDSQGVLQQRPSQGWGPPGDPAADINEYLERARALDRKGFRGTPGQLAQAIQRSAYPGRYDERGEEAARLLGSRPSALSVGGGGGERTGPSEGAPTSVPADLRRQFALSLIQGRPVRESIGLARAIRQQASVPESESATPNIESTPAGSGFGGLDEIIYQAPGHWNHLHVGEGDDPDLMLRLIRRAQQLGLTVRENPLTDPVDPVHVKGSYHYRRFPGRKVGGGADISGDKKALARLYRELGGKTRY